jgi:ribonucleoside-diphosphate reductase beta chain
MNLLDKRDTYRPILYPQALEYWKKQQQAHWLVEEIDFNEDKRDWDTKLTDGERNFLSKIFRFFTQTDVDVATAYYDKYIPVLGGQPELKMMMGSFANMEGIHIAAYAKVLDTVGMPDAEFSAFKQHKQMLAKHDYVGKFTPNQEMFHADVFGLSAARESKKQLAKTLAVYSAFTEGLSLFSSFAMLMNFQRFGKMKGMGKVVEWSIRDETLHVEAMTWLFRTFIKENPEIWTDEFKKELYQICRDIVKLEDAFIDLCFKEAGELEGITAEEVKKYIRFIADRRLADLGLKPNYHVKENPLDWMSWMVLNSHGNFFETRVTEYAKGVDDQSEWDGVFG